MAANIEEVTAQELENVAEQFLSNTDWMVNKAVDDPLYTIPSHVADKRKYARTLIDTALHKAATLEMFPIFYEEPDHALAFKNLVVFKSTQMPDTV